MGCSCLLAVRGRSGSLVEMTVCRKGEAVLASRGSVSVLFIGDCPFLLGEWLLPSNVWEAIESLSDRSSAIEEGLDCATPPK